MRFSLIPCHIVTALALNHYNMINPIQSNTGNSRNKQTNARIKQTMQLKLLKFDNVYREKIADYYMLGIMEDYTLSLSLMTFSGAYWSNQ